MKCPTCGLELEAVARFCGGCGARLHLDESARPQNIAHEPMVPDVPSPLARGANAPAAVVGGPAAAGERAAARTPGGAAAPAVASTGGRRDRSEQAFGATLSAARVPVAALGGAVVERGDPFVGTVLNGRYKIEAKLGQGGFGAVYKGHQLTIGREVALKVLHPEMARDFNLVARFRREGAVACNLRDAHTITTYDFDQTPEGVLYIAMELLAGRSLHDIFHAEAPLPWLRVVRILEQMCSSLGEAHRQGIVHRDIKPENIYLEDRPGHPDFVKVLDFGIAKIVRGDIGGGGSAAKVPQLTATGQTLGTLEYMSPEQLMGKQLDGRSDIYAMGVLGFELMTGRLPFPEAMGPAELIAAQLRKTPPAPSSAHPEGGIPPSVEAVILQMLEKDRGKRYADVDQVREALAQAVASHLAAGDLASAPGLAPAGASAPAPVAPSAAGRSAEAPRVLPALVPGATPQVVVVDPAAEQPTPVAGVAAVTPGRWWIWALAAGIALGGAVAAIWLTFVAR